MAKSKRSTTDSLFNWLGRQIGHVRKAVKTEVKPPPTVIYRDGKVEEAEHPNNPDLKLRRTVIDEVIVDESKKPLR